MVFGRQKKDLHASPFSHFSTFSAALEKDNFYRLSLPTATRAESLAVLLIFSYLGAPGLPSQLGAFSNPGFSQWHTSQGSP